MVNYRLHLLFENAYSKFENIPFRDFKFGYFKLKLYPTFYIHPR